jgi:hypothetical protein
MVGVLVEAGPGTIHIVANPEKDHSGYSALGALGVLGNLAHEFGHAHQRNAVGTSLTKYYSKRIDFWDEEAMEAARTISEHAATVPGEAYAEAFATALIGPKIGKYLSPQACSPYATNAPA